MQTTPNSFEKHRRLLTGYLPISRLEHFFVGAVSDEFFFLKRESPYKQNVMLPYFLLLIHARENICVRIFVRYMKLSNIKPLFGLNKEDELYLFAHLFRAEN